MIEIAAPDPAWPARFAAERDRLAPLLAGVALHHIGSTAVPGLAAKPIVDLMAIAGDIDAVADVLVRRGGYVLPAEINARLDRRRYLTRPSMAERAFNLHLLADAAMLERYLIFRERLRADAALRDEYAELKRALAARFGADREAYTDAKGPFIARVEALGLP